MISLAIFHHRNPQKLFECKVWLALLWLSEKCELEIRSSGGNLRFHFTAVYWSWEYFVWHNNAMQNIRGSSSRTIEKEQRGKDKIFIQPPQICSIWRTFWMGVLLSETPFDRLYLMFWWAKSINKKCHSDMTWGAGPSLVSLQIYSFCSQLTHFSDASSPFFL